MKNRKTTPINHKFTSTVEEMTCKVKSNSSLNNEYHLLILDVSQQNFVCQPGQFFNLLCPQSVNLRPYLRRPMSIYGHYPDKGELQFLYKVTGEGTVALSQLIQGDFLNVLGPLGQGFEIKNDWNNLLILARGVGLATLVPLAIEARQKGKNLTAICSARSPDVLMSIEQFKDLGANVIAVTDKEGNSNVDDLNTLIDKKIINGEVDAFFTCGSNRLLKILQSLGKKHSIPGQIALEQQMACGLGMCQCCVRSFRTGGKITHKRVCKEGPVFDIQEAMAW